MLQQDNVSTGAWTVQVRTIQRIASFFFDLPEAGSPPLTVFLAFGMAGQAFSKVFRVKLSSHKGPALGS